jgi:hypothetical protein
MLLMCLLLVRAMAAPADDSTAPTTQRPKLLSDMANVFLDAIFPPLKVRTVR